MATKLAFAIALGIAYPLLWLAGFDAGQSTNGSVALWTLAVLYGLLPVVIKLSVVALMWNFPLDRRRHAQLQDDIGRRSGRSSPQAQSS